MPHPLLQPGDGDAAANSLNKKAMPDAFRKGMRPAADASIGNHAAYLLVHGLFALRPQFFRRPQPGLDAADLMNLIEKLEKGIRHGNRSPDSRQVRQQAGKNDHPAREIDLLGREVERLREIAAGVMQEAAKGPGL